MKTNGKNMNFTQLPEEGVQASDIQAADFRTAPDQADGAVRDAAPSAVPPFWIEATDERGEALMVHRDAVAVIRDAGVHGGDVRSVMILNSGTMVPLRTTFSTLIKRMRGE